MPRRFFADDGRWLSSETPYRLPSVLPLVNLLKLQEMRAERLLRLVDRDAGLENRLETLADKDHPVGGERRGPPS
ncbi:hypothetical protein [Ensifer canadensis]